MTIFTNSRIWFHQRFLSGSRPLPQGFFPVLRLIVWCHALFFWCIRFLHYQYIPNHQDNSCFLKGRIAPLPHESFPYLLLVRRYLLRFLGLTRSTLDNWRSQICDPPADTLQSIVGAFDSNVWSASWESSPARKEQQMVLELIVIKLLMRLISPFQAPVPNRIN